MANRHLSRSIVVQSLFEWDFYDCDRRRMKKIVERNINEFAPGLEDTSFVWQLIDGILSKKETLDGIIIKAAPQWPLAQIAPVDRNILRLGLWELLYADKEQVSGRVAINEAIELAKTFGGESSGSFINGVLGAVYREMGEPDKDEPPKRKTRIKDLPYEQMPVEKLGGAVVYGRPGGKLSLALVLDIFGYWTLPKGHLVEGEELKAGVARKVREETGLEASILSALGENEYVSTDPERGKIRKSVSYFLAEAKNPGTLILGETSGLKDVRWWPLKELGDLKMYNDVLPLVTKAVRRLAGQER